MDTSKVFGEAAPITETIFDITAISEAGGEYTMPDYYPQIKRLVSYTAEPLPDTKFLSGSSLESGGTLAFTVTYIGEDSSLVSLPYTAEYSASVPLPEELTQTGDIGVDALCTDIQCRVLGPRKISVKGKVCQSIYAYKPLKYALSCKSTDGKDLSLPKRASIQLLHKSIPSMAIGRGSAGGKASGELQGSSDMKPVSCSASICILEASAKKDSCILRGEAVLRLLVFTPEGIYAPLRAALPFEETVSAQGARPGDHCRGWGRCTSVNVSLEEGTLKLQCEYDIEAEWCRRGDFIFTEDAYSTCCSAELEAGSLRALNPICCLNSSLSLSGKGKRTTKPTNGEYITDMWCHAEITEAEVGNEAVSFSGKCHIKAYIAANGEIICEDIRLPIKYQCPPIAQWNGSKPIIRSHISVSELSGRLEGDAVAASCCLCLSICCMGEAELHPVCAIRLNTDENLADSRAAIRVFYPQSQQRVWDVAKKYLADAQRIEELNKVSREDICSEPLIIPHR